MKRIRFVRDVEDAPLIVCPPVKSGEYGLAISCQKGKEIEVPDEIAELLCVAGIVEAMEP